MLRLFQLGMLGLLVTGLVSCEPGGPRGGPKGDGGDKGTEASKETPAAPEAEPAETEATPSVGGTSGGPPSATIKGTVTYEGAPQRNPPLPIPDSDPVCKEAHPTPVDNPSFVIAESGALANVLVSVSKGLEGQTFDVPQEPAVFDQKGCLYTPHVFAVMAGQKIEVKNSDPTLHNVHMRPAKNREFNTAMPGIQTKTTSFNRPEDQPVPIGCDVHAWMKAFAGVFSHPYFAVTDADGKFELPTIAPGEYVLTAWHERLGELTQTVKVEKDATQEITFKFTK